MSQGSRIDKLYYELDVVDAPFSRKLDGAERRLGQHEKALEASGKRAGEKAGAAVAQGAAKGTEAAGAKLRDAQGKFTRDVGAGAAAAAKRAQKEYEKAGDDAAMAYVRRFKATSAREMADLKELRARGRQGMEGGISEREYRRQRTALESVQERRVLEGIANLGDRGQLTQRGFMALSGLLKDPRIKANAGKVAEDVAAEYARRFKARYERDLAALREQGALKGWGRREMARRRAALDRESNERVLGGIAQLRGTGQLTEAGMKGLTSMLKNTTGEVGALDRAFGFLGMRMGAVRALGLAGIVLVGVGAAVKIINALTDSYVRFEAAMVRSTAYMETSPMQDRALGDNALRLSRDLNIAATELAGGYMFLAQSGMDAEASMAALPVVATFAKAGLMDLEKATSLLLDSTKALGKDSRNASQNMANMSEVADLLTAASIASNASIQSLAESITNKGGSALRLLNKDMTEGVAVLAAYADVGLKGAAAGEALNMVLRDLQKAALGNQAAFKKYGIEVFDANGKMRHTGEIIAQMETAFANLSDAQKRAAVMELGFQDRSVSRLLQLMGRSGEILRFQEEFTQTTGSTASVAQRQLKSLEERQGQLGKGWEALKVRAGEALSPIRGWAITAGEGLLNALEGPIETITRRLQRMGSTAQYALAIQMRALSTENKAAMEDLRGDLDSPSVRIAALPQRGRGGALDLNYLRNAGRLQETITDTSVGNLTRLQAETQRRIGELLAQESQATGKDQREIQRLLLAAQRRDEQLQTLIDKRQELGTRELEQVQIDRSREEALAKARLEQQILQRNAELAAAERELIADPTSSTYNARVTKLKRERDALQKTLEAWNAGVQEVEEVVNEEGGMPTIVDDSAVSAAKSARAELEKVAATLRVIGSFSKQDGSPFRSLEEMPDRLREAVQKLLASQEELRGLEEKISTARKGGQAVPAEAAARAVQLRAMVREQEEEAKRVRDSLKPEEFLHADVRKAREELEQMAGPFRALAALGFPSISAIPDEIRAAVSETARLGSEIDKVRKLVQDATSRGQAAPEGSTGILEDLERQRIVSERTTAQLLAMGDALEYLPDGQVRAFLQGLNADLTSGPFAPGGQAAAELTKIADAIRLVSQARTDQAFARMAGDTDAYVAATRRLNEAQEAAKRKVRELIPSFRALNLTHQQQEDILKLVESALGDVSVELDAVADRWQSMEQGARVFGALARAVADAGREMGVLDGAAGDVLDTLASSADAVAGFATSMTAALAKASTGNIAAAVAAGIGLVGTVVGGIKKVFGGDDKARKELEKQRRQSDYQLIQALDRLREAVLQDVSSEQAKKDVQGVSGLIRALQAEIAEGGKQYRDGSRSESLRRQDLADAAVAMGLAEKQRSGENQGAAKARQVDALRAYVADLDERYGLNLSQYIENNDVVGLLNQLNNSLPVLREKLDELGMFGKDVAGVIAQVNFEFETLGKTDAAEKIREIVKRLKEGGKSFGEFGDELEELAGLDLNTEAGRKRMEEILASMVENLKDGANLGDLTADEIRELIRGFREAGSEAGGLVSGGSNEQRLNISTTEVQSSQQLSVLSTIAYHAAGMHEIMAAWANRPAPMLTPPPLRDAQMGAGSVVTVEQVDVHVEVPLDGTLLELAELEAAIERLAREGGVGVGRAIQAGMQSATQGMGYRGAIRVDVRMGGNR